MILDKEQKKLKKQIEVLSQVIKTLESTGVDKSFLEMSKRYQSERRRIHKEILCRYASVFAIVENVRELSILGVQNVDLLVQKNEVDFNKCIKRYRALKPMMIKYRDIFDEIICLVENGFTDGAMQRWRTFFEYSVIIIFILEQGEDVANAFVENWFKSMENELKPITNFAWAKEADCLKGEKQVNIKIIFENINAFDIGSRRIFHVLYKWTCQLIHGSSIGINMSFNDYISEGINDLKDADYYYGGICTVITNTMNLLFQTYTMYFNIFPVGDLNVRDHWKGLRNEYVKIVKNFLSRDV